MLDPRRRLLAFRPAGSPAGSPAPGGSPRLQLHADEPELLDGARRPDPANAIPSARSLHDGHLIALELHGHLGEVRHHVLLSELRSAPPPVQAEASLGMLRPMRDATSTLTLPLFLTLLGACAGAPPDDAAPQPSLAQPEPSPAQPPPPASSSTPARAPALVGVLTRERIETEVPAWKAVREQSTVDESAARALASAPPGAEVLVVLGTWCGDSRRDVPRLFRALDVAGKVPFSIELLGLDHDKAAPGRDMAALDVRYIPTIIVRREGKEVGRIVESAPDGVEKSLLDLLTGKRTGLITGRTDLGPTAR